jgi:hypothetical protein
MLAILCAAMSVPAAAEVPMLLNHHGRLSDASGQPAEGTVSMSFTVFDAPSGGNPLPAGGPWGETHSVQVTGGAFNVLLGSIVPIPQSLFDGGPSDGFGPRRYLQVTVGGEALQPRQRIVSGAYALRAKVADFAETPTVQGPTGPPGPQGPPGPAVSSFAVCKAVQGPPCPSSFCSCSGSRQLVFEAGPCTVTSNTGSCTSLVGGSNTCAFGSCCVCAP